MKSIKINSVIFVCLTIFIIQGDSGAPLACPVQGESNIFVLSAISSYGIKCNENPAVYTNVQKFVDWIKEHSEIPSAY